MVFNSNFFNSNSEEQEKNILIEYLQKQNPEILTRVAQSATPEIKEIISNNVKGLVGMLPPEGFNVQIATDRENLGTLLASAMMTGYFLHQMEQRMNLESTLSDSDSMRQ
jgi:hypothetical protein